MNVVPTSYQQVPQLRLNPTSPLQVLPKKNKKTKPTSIATTKDYETSTNNSTKIHKHATSFKHIIHTSRNAPHRTIVCIAILLDQIKVVHATTKVNLFLWYGRGVVVELAMK